MITNPKHNNNITIENRNVSLNIDSNDLNGNLKSFCLTICMFSGCFAAFDFQTLE